MRSDIAISVRNLTKTYRLFGHPGDRIKQFFSLGLKQYHREFTALREVSFDIKRGETVGIIGRNGSGKSTLLQLICGILKPTAGTVQVDGRVSALLELGAGFNPEFTGRENVLFQGALVGISKEDMTERFDIIADFADIGEFIDQPVGVYSSGMYVRLAFSVAVHVSPDIVVIDEALAVGDIEFQKKCFDRIHEIQEMGTTIIVVSHNPYQIERLCHRVGLLHEKRLSELRPAKDTLALYYNLMQSEYGPLNATHKAFREGTHELTFNCVSITHRDGRRTQTVDSGQPMKVIADFTVVRPMKDVRFRFEIFSAANEMLSMITSVGITENFEFYGEHSIEFDMSRCQLTSGWYYLNAVAVGKELRLDTWQRAAEFQVSILDQATRNLSADQGIFVSEGLWRLSSG